MRDRLDLIHTLLRDDGTLFVHIDDNELGYLVVLLDEIFRRENRVAVITFKQGSATGHKAINPGCVNTSNFVLIYAKRKAAWMNHRLFTARERDKRYSQFIPNRKASYQSWEFTTLGKAFAASRGKTEKEVKQELGDGYERQMDQFVLENADSVTQLAKPNYEGVSAAARDLIDQSSAEPDRVFHLPREGHEDLYLLKGKRILFYSSKLKKIDGRYVAGEPLTTIWDDILSNNLHQEGGVALQKGKKPEGLIKRVVEMSTAEGDWVLDSFAGSGTTAAVAHKMNRRWITCELGELCHTHVIPRLRRVVDGQDSSGITQAVNWKGGGGFKYYRLAESLLVRDKDLSTKNHPVYIINPRYNERMLIQAICKVENFRYRNEGRLHGISSERRFLHVTTRLLTQGILDSLAEDIGPDQSLLIYCTRKVRELRVPDNIDVKKIPRDLLAKCDFQEDK